MAITDRNSTQIANLLDNTPSVRNDTSNADGVMRTALGYIANAADDSATSVQRAVRIPSNANVRSVKLSTGDATTAGAIDVGVYYADDNPASATGAEIDADFFADAFDLTSGPIVKTELLDQDGANNTIVKQQLPLWEALGLSSDPGGYFDVAVTIATTYNGAAVGQLFEVQYTL